MFSSAVLVLKESVKAGQCHLELTAFENKWSACDFQAAIVRKTFFAISNCACSEQAVCIDANSDQDMRLVFAYRSSFWQIYIQTVHTVTRPCMNSSPLFCKIFFTIQEALNRHTTS